MLLARWSEVDILAERMREKRVVILGAAGRDFHDFNCCFRADASTRVVAFTATQIPGIDDRCYPAALAGPRYPAGVPIRAESELSEIIREHAVDEVVFAYSDVSHAHVMHLAARANASGAAFRLLGVAQTMLSTRLPTIAVCAVRTGCGKSQTSRYVVRHLRALGLRPVVIRHPMPYGDLARQVVQRFSSYGDLDRHACTLEEREEYEGHLEAGTVVYAGVDYARILDQAQTEADVLIWDGGNNDTPFIKPDLWITVADPLRPGHELLYYPGEVNLRAADVVLINKTGSARPADVEEVARNTSSVNPSAVVIRADSALRIEGSAELAGKRVLALEDGPTLTHGSMAFGAAAVAAERAGAEIVDPRPHAVGSIAQVYRDYPHLGGVLPAMGYSESQLEELRQTIEATSCDLVLYATPVDLTRLVRLDKAAVRVRYELEDLDRPTLADQLDQFAARHRAR